MDSVRLMRGGSDFRAAKPLLFQASSDAKAGRIGKRARSPDFELLLPCMRNRDPMHPYIYQDLFSKPCNRNCHQNVQALVCTKRGIVQQLQNVARDPLSHPR